MATIASAHAAALAKTRTIAAPAYGFASQDRASRSGIWVGIFAITMSFAAFTSALFVREGTADWGHLVLPSLLYGNTLVLAASSGTFEIARRSLATGSLIESDGARKALAWLAVTLLLGLAFCVGQYMVWQQLRAVGIYLATNPNSSFFYVLTVVHALHVLAGICVLVYLIARLMASHTTFRRSRFENTAIYWHFMGVLWLYLFLLCRVKL
jgi:cytochrome c oxidase subunit III